MKFNRDSPLKLFTGTEIGRETWSRDLDYLSIHDFPPETLVLVSSPQDIETEWRFLVADRKVIDGSMYKHQGILRAERSSDVQALELAKRICSAPYQPDPVWVLDICKTANGQYALLEIGGFSFSSLYACKKDLVVEAVSRVIAGI